MQSSHLVPDVLGVDVFILAPTVSGDGAGARFCASLSPSPPPFDFTYFFCELKLHEVLAHDFIKRGEMKLREVHDLIIFFVK